MQVSLHILRQPPRLCQPGAEVVCRGWAGERGVSLPHPGSAAVRGARGDGTRQTLLPAIRPVPPKNQSVMTRPDH